MLVQVDELVLKGLEPPECQMDSGGRTTLFGRGPLGKLFCDMACPRTVIGVFWGF